MKMMLRSRRRFGGGRAGGGGSATLGCVRMLFVAALGCVYLTMQYWWARGGAARAAGPVLANWHGNSDESVVPSAPPVLVLTPVRNSNPRRAARYLRNLAALDYDHAALHVALLADAASVDVFRAAIDAHARDPGPAGAFASLRVFEEPPAMAARNRDQRERVRHAHAELLQRRRRRNIAAARNYLLSAAGLATPGDLGGGVHGVPGSRAYVQASYGRCPPFRGAPAVQPAALAWFGVGPSGDGSARALRSRAGTLFEWALWMDSDLLAVPADLLPRLVAAGEDIVVPRCLGPPGGTRAHQVYDLNSWQETPESAAKLAAVAPGKLVWEGHARNRLGRLHFGKLTRLVAEVNRRRARYWPGGKNPEAGRDAAGAAAAAAASTETNHLYALPPEPPTRPPPPPPSPPAAAALVARREAEEPENEYRLRLESIAALLHAMPGGDAGGGDASAAAGDAAAAATAAAVLGAELGAAVGDALGGGGGGGTHVARGAEGGGGGGGGGGGVSGELFQALFPPASDGPPPALRQKRKGPKPFTPYDLELVEAMVGDDAFASGKVRLDGIGGTVVLVRARLHRQGLNFPTFVVNHALETEGLAQVALRMGVQPWGLTDVVVRHA